MSEREYAPVVGLTGGMGAGKSTVGRELAKLGAVVIDADEIVRDLYRPGELGFVAVVGLLGEEVVKDDGLLNTKKVASIIFADEELRGDVEKAVHPLVWDKMWGNARSLDPSQVAVFESPLLNRESAAPMDGVVVVNTDPDIAVERLSGRGFTPQEARARISTQMSNQERASLADFVIVNNSAYEELLESVREAWNWMGAL